MALQTNAMINRNFHRYIIFLYLASLAHQKRAPMVPVQSYDPMTTKHGIYSDRDGYELEREWIEDYQEWLTIRVEDCLENRK